jgi:hypothetical protein
MIRKLLATCMILSLAIGLSASAPAADYYFAVEKETVHVYWNADGTLGLDYAMTFANQGGAHVIDFVDMGMPNGNFDLGTASADVDGKAVDVSQSDYQGSGSGFAVVLGSQAIQPGSRGTVHVHVGRISNVLYPDTENAEYASAVFSPTYFGNQYVTGSTDLTVIFHLPPGVKPEEPKYHKPGTNWPGAEEPETALDSNGRVQYTWHSTEANAYTQYKFGASFPKSYVPADVVQVAPPVDISLPNINFDGLSNCCCFGFFGLMFFGLPILGVFNERKRKMQYLPPKISIEGHGIKRGLTAVEAAILMEQPLDKVMTMILFGVLKKNAATVTSRDPLTLQVEDPLPEDLRDYEKDFLAAFKQPNAAGRRTGLQDMTVKLIRSVGEKMKGFSRKETVAYYQSINERAWQQIDAAGTPEVKSQMFEEAMEWTMLDKDYDDRARRTFTGPVFVPMWWHRYDPSFGGGGGASVSSAGGGMPSFTPTRGQGVPGAAFAASVVGGVQNFSSKVIGDVGGFTSRVTNVTNPPPPPSRSSGGHSGGGCACACACAGCACACAGGGR